MASLPLELLQVITTEVEHDPSIFSLRLVSKIFNSVASPLAFRVVVVNDSVKSGEAISFLQGCDESLTSLVRELVFRGDREGGTGWRDETSGESGRNALKSAFSWLSNFPNLQSLRFDFHNCYQEDYFDDIPEDPTHFALLQTDIFAALAANPLPPLVSLTLNNMLVVPYDIYTEENFLGIFAPLQQLNISFLTDSDQEGGYYHEPFVNFWETHVASIVRSARALTALTISSDMTIGVSPSLSFLYTSFPHLTSLALYHFALDPATPHTDVVAFVLRHKATLARLELHGCSIDGGTDGVFPRPWHAVFALFETELRGLREFVFEHDIDALDSDSERQPGRFRYTCLNLGGGFWCWEGVVPGEDQDFPALESLMAVVESRRGKHKGVSAEDK
ncbi:hypothetical protein B0H19DRAFT_1263981 [Mycena capillaripes]|nr:hypothetical protein B0H19DRAFT_1263981 [Mycena capillaripes]